MNTIRESPTGWRAQYGYCPGRGYYVDVFNESDFQLVAYDCGSEDYDAANPLEGALWTLVGLEFLDGACVQDVLWQRESFDGASRKGRRRVERVLRTLQEEAHAA